MIRSQTVYIVECDARNAGEHARHKVTAESMAAVNLRMRSLGWQVSPGGERHLCPRHRKLL